MGVVAAVLVSCLVAVLLVPVRTRGIPDAFFRTSITYTPEQGPPNPALLDSRPEQIVQRYLADYIGLAGTYPCLQDLSSVYDDLQDPVLHGQPCPVTRPVASFRVTAVTIRSHGLAERPEATVSVIVTYTDGRQWTGTIGMFPDRYLNLVLIYLHLDCWDAGSNCLVSWCRTSPQGPRTRHRTD